MNQFIQNQSYISAFGYLLVILAMGRAIWHWLDVRELTLRLAVEKKEIDEFLSHPENRVTAESQLPATHPLATVIAKLRDNPNLGSQVSELIDIHVQSLLFSKAARSQSNQGQAVFFGFLGTLIGILCGSLTYDSGNVGSLLQNIGLAMVTTMIGGIASEIESHTIRVLDSLNIGIASERPEFLEKLSWLRFERVVVEPTPPSAVAASTAVCETEASACPPSESVAGEAVNSQPVKHGDYSFCI